jgi:hypothetical protein
MIYRIGGFFLYLLFLLVYRTCQFTYHGLDQLDDLIENEAPFIVTSWHGMTMMVAALLKKKMDVSAFCVIVPDDVRGDALEVFAHHLGVDPIKLILSGDNTFSSGRKLVGLLKKISGGKNFLIHPDGPAGPAYQIKPGLTFIAQKSGASILPLGCYCRNAYHVKRWDRYTLPLPFSKVHIQIGQIFNIPDEMEDLAEINLQLGDILNQLTLQASANYYES